MTANELRIGNWINYAFSGDVQIKDKESFFNVLKALEDKYTVVKPIPLTEEWLTKFGFVKRSVFYIKRMDDFDIYFKNKNGVFLLDGLFLNESSGEDVMSKEIKYVHQLQNLYFALTNEELTIQ